MKKFYALCQAKAGSFSTFNGKCIDKIHSFDTKKERDEFCEYSGNHVLTRAEAEVEARSIYGVNLSKLDRASSFSNDESFGSSQLDCYTRF